jgi:hypothetical protein
VRRSLGFETERQVDGFLKQHVGSLEQTLDDIVR